ncbi:MAG: hypothetical protein CISAcid_15680 [uncultured Acidilobus sp. CIS]|jgi:hypothetical protein|nr:MAG: hypothetical protein CISAcid_15680 [uncultured Acidilobus sp. CIS]
MLRPFTMGIPPLLGFLSQDLAIAMASL